MSASAAPTAATTERPRNQRSRPEEFARASKTSSKPISAASRRNPRRSTRGPENVTSQSPRVATSVVSGQDTQSLSRLVIAEPRGSNGNRSHQTGNNGHQRGPELSPLVLNNQTANVRQSLPAPRPAQAVLPEAANPPYPSSRPTSHPVPHIPAPLPLPPAYVHDEATRQMREEEARRRRREMDTHPRVSLLVPAVPTPKSSFSRLWQPPAVPRQAVNSAPPQKAPLGFTARRRDQAPRGKKRLYAKLPLGHEATAPISDKDLKDDLAQAISETKHRAAEFAYTQAPRRVEDDDLLRLRASQGYFSLGAVAR